MSSTPLSIVIPAFDEASRLPASLYRIAEFLADRRNTTEILVVDDGSRDDTRRAAEEASARLGLRLRTVSHARNHGKGRAARTGMLAATGDRLLLTDADLSVPMEFLDVFLARCDAVADMVIGSRHLAASILARRQSPMRERLGAAFRTIAASAVAPGISDFTCGFKLFRRAAAARIFGLQRIDGWGFDVEICVIARSLGLVIAEEPVTWTNDPGTRVRLVRDVLRSGSELARIRWNMLRGRYQPDEAAQLLSAGADGAEPTDP